MTGNADENMAASRKKAREDAREALLAKRREQSRERRAREREKRESSRSMHNASRGMVVG